MHWFPYDPALTSLLSRFSRVQLSATLWIVAARLLPQRESPGKNAGVGCPALLQGIFPAQGWNLRLLSPALAGGVSATRTTWEAQLSQQHMASGGSAVPIQYREVISLQLK